MPKPPRQWMPDEFGKAPPPIQPIKPERTSRKAELETLAALDHMRETLLSGETGPRLGAAIGRLRAHINFIRSEWNVRTSAIDAAREAYALKLDARYRPQNTEARSPRAIDREPPIW